jgi:hypothetical protein
MMIDSWVHQHLRDQHHTQYGSRGYLPKPRCEYEPTDLAQQQAEDGGY